MADNSKIEWTDATWNPITGCSVVSPGCTNCYAMKLAGTRMKHHPSRKGLTVDSKAGPVWNGQVRFNAEWLSQPLSWKRPRRIFVCAHGDLFHPAVPDEWIDQVFAVMALAPQHQFQVLTKRPERMREYLTSIDEEPQIDTVRRFGSAMNAGRLPAPKGDIVFPLPNVWLGTSVEDQKRADERIPHLLATPAAVRFLSVEPLLGPVDLRRIHEHGETESGGSWDSWESSLNGKRFSIWSDGDIDGQPKIDWVIVGGESGPDARPMHADWVRAIRDQCAAAGVPFFFKQWGAWVGADDYRAHLAEAGIQVLGRNDGEDVLRPLPSGPLSFDDAAKVARAASLHFEHHSDGSTLIKVGKGRAGRLLDGVTHDAMPEVRHG